MDSLGNPFPCCSLVKNSKRLSYPELDVRLHMPERMGVPLDPNVRYRWRGLSLTRSTVAAELRIGKARRTGMPVADQQGRCT